MQITHSDRWLAVGLEAQFEPFSSQPAVLDGYGVAVWRGPTGPVQVWEDRCPHRGMRLSFGFVKGDRLSCMYHGWSFQPDGHCRRIPAHPDLEPPKTICAKTFAVTIFRGIVFANLAAAPEAPPPVPDESAWAPVRSIYVNRSIEVVRARAAAGAGFGPTACDLGAGVYEVATDASGRVTLALQPAEPGRTAMHVTSELTGSAGERRLDIARLLVSLRRDLEAH